jgi:hypothetical protein
MAESIQHQAGREFEKLAFNLAPEIGGIIPMQQANGMGSQHAGVRCW